MVQMILPRKKHKTALATESPGTEEREERGSVGLERTLGRGAVNWKMERRKR